MRFLWLLILFCPVITFGRQQDSNDESRSPLMQVEQIELSTNMPAIAAQNEFWRQAQNFSFQFARPKYRGLSSRYNPLYINHLEQNSLLSGAEPWGALAYHYAYSDANNIISPADAVLGFKATAAFGNRTYTYRLGVGYNYKTKNGWAVAADVSARFGRSLSVSGIFAAAGGLYIGGEKRWGSGARLSLVALFAPSQRSAASPITREAAALTGSNLYNPAWGWQQGKERSSKVRNTLEPVFIINHSTPLGEKFTISNAAQVRFGSRSTSALNWQGAPNPLPDYYRYMPSGQSSPQAAAGVEAAWRLNPNVQQVDFANMYAVNKKIGGRANYIVENRVEQPLAITLQSTLSHKNFDAGVVVRYENSRNFKTVADMVGGGYWLDIDSYVEQDEDIKDKTQNNLRNPNGHVGVGDRFGYDFTLSAFNAKIWGGYHTKIGRWELSAAAATQITAFQRVGYYEKENFASGRSYGASQAAIFVNVDAALKAQYSIGSMLNFTAALNYKTLPPTAPNIFPDARYRNFVNPHAVNEQFFGASAEANYKSEKIRGRAAIYYNRIWNGVDSRQMYDDIASEYIIYAMRGIESAYFGVELSGEFLLTDALYLNFALFFQHNSYLSNPDATAYKQSTGVVAGTYKTDYEGLRVPLSPQSMGVLALAYRPRGWTAQISASAAGGNYVALSPLRRTANAALVDIAQQEKLPTAISVDIFGGYNFYFASSSLSLYAGVNNLLNNRNICSAGYEANRLFKSYETYPAKHTPQPSKYYYALPINFFINATYRF